MSAASHGQEHGLLNSFGLLQSSCPNTYLQVLMLLKRREMDGNSMPSAEGLSALLLGAGDLFGQPLPLMRQLGSAVPNIRSYSSS